MMKGKLSRKGKGIIKRFLIISPYNYNAFNGGGYPFHPFSFSNSRSARKDKTNDALKEMPKTNPYINPLSRLVK